MLPILEMRRRQGAAIRHVIHNRARVASVLMELRRAVEKLDGVAAAVRDVETSGLNNDEASEIRDGLARTIAVLNALRRKCERSS